MHDALDGPQQIEKPASPICLPEARSPMC